MPTPAPPSPTPSPPATAAPGSSPGQKQCQSTGAHAGYTDSWCTSNCNHANPNCPAAYCTCTGGGTDGGGGGGPALAPPTPAPPSPTPAAAPGASPGMGQCRSTASGTGFWEHGASSRRSDLPTISGSKKKAVLPVLAAPASEMFSHVAVTGSCSAARRRPATRPVHLAVQVVKSAAVFDLGIATPLSLMMVIFNTAEDTD